jgi:5-methylcytosine-specific restriction endonuclease McrA
MTLECLKCGRKLFLDETDDDEIHNAYLEGWDFALVTDMETLCPKCKDNQELHEAVAEF